MTVKEFAAGSAKALLTTTKVLFRILVGLISAFFSFVLIAASHNKPTRSSSNNDGCAGAVGDDGLTAVAREEYSQSPGPYMW